MLTVFSFLSAPAGAKPPNPDGYYSRKAVALWDQLARNQTAITLYSPDGSSQVEAHYIENRGDYHVTLYVKGRIGVLKVNIGLGVGSEVLWAADSESFFVTTSDQGANGLYRLIVVGRFGGRLQSKDVSKLIYSVFGHPVRCGWPEPPNVAGVGWLPSGNVLVAAEIVNHSNCDSSGTFRAFEVNPTTLTIVNRYGQLEAKKRFRSLLGRELRDAPDDCIARPRSCFVSANHPEMHTRKP